MSDARQNVVFYCADGAFSRFNIEKDIAAYIKKELTKVYGGNWNCIVGKKFGSLVASESFIHFNYNDLGIIAFKS